jgi:hypothetical protein
MIKEVMAITMLHKSLLRSSKVKPVFNNIK